MPAYKGKLLSSIDNETNDEYSEPVDAAVVSGTAMTSLAADTDWKRREDKARMVAMVDSRRIHRSKIRLDGCQISS